MRSDVLDVLNGFKYADKKTQYELPTFVLRGDTSIMLGKTSMVITTNTTDVLLEEVRVPYENMESVVESGDILKIRHRLGGSINIVPNGIELVELEV